MAKKKMVSVEFLLNMINTIFFLLALATLFYALYFLFKWKHYASIKPQPNSYQPKQDPPARILLAFASSKWLFDELPTPWFDYFIMAVAAILLFISCFGFIGAAVRSPGCLCFYSVILVGFILAQLGIAALVFFGHLSSKDLPGEKTGTLLSAYQYLNKNWKIIRWVDLAILTLEVIALFLALYLRFVYQGSDDWDRQENIVHLDSLRRAAARQSNIKTPTPPPSTTGRREQPPTRQ